MRHNAAVPKRALVLAAVIALIAAALYAPARNFGLVWDDPVVIQQQLPRLDSWRLAFFPPTDIPELAPVYYRPLVIVSYLVDQRLPDAAPPARAFHLTTVLWHALACIALFGFTRRLARALAFAERRATSLASAVALLFATAPIHVDAVAAITGRADVMATAFVCFAAWSYLAQLQRGGAMRLALSTACLLAALLSKETGIAAIPLLLWLDIALGDDAAVTSRPRRWLVLAVPLALYLSLRALALHGMGQSVYANSLSSIEAQPWAVLPALGWYLRKLAWPLPQSPFVPSAGGLVLGVVGVLAAAALITLLWRAWRRGHNAPEAVGIVLLLAALVPALCVPLMGVTYLPVAERYLYLPSAGALIAVVLFGARRLPRAAALIVVLVAAALGSWQTVVHQTVWRDPLTLWTAARDTAPMHHIPYAMLGRELAALQRYGEAESSYRRGIELAIDGKARAALRNNLGSLQRRRGGAQADAAAYETFRAAITDDPRHWPALYNFALTALSLARSVSPVQQAPLLDEAVDALTRAKAVAPGNLDLRLLLARTLAAAGHRDESRREASELIALAPSSEQAREVRALQ